MARLYKNMEIYHLSYAFALDVYKLTQNFPKEEQGNLISQMRRAAVSIPLNIVEGTTRHSEKAFLSFLTYSYGSAKELDVLLSFAKDLGYISEEEYDVTFQKLDCLMAKLFKFMNNIERKTPTNFFRKFEEKARV